HGAFPQGGVVGVSNMEQGSTSPGVHGQSTVAEGVLGEAIAGEQAFPANGTHGVRGRTFNDNAAGVRAEHTGDGPGLHATSAGGGPGVLGIGLYGNGVVGFGSTAVVGVGVTGRTGPNSRATGVYGSVDLPTEGSVGVAGEMFLEWSGVPVNGVSGRTNSAPGS